ncbi:hypothetical protein Val02_51050 [Virgisporangium aliadipatigenens]|uniref:AAA+ ATPase domain-containing protein n=1 Tax=Virgisporangium aliadipatigenens TaxID=741659 RepID=A0A8J4DS05_9ACTN|nr:AAA family ATPase [Virgisporangium aliadipatigenens]GIJ48219.1 hypothetical protein Val02_51050 [Virgisporangium aliadipatigenens]
MFVGRDHERQLFRAMLAAPEGHGPLLYLHGPGGIGKSVLLRHFAELADTAGREVVSVDGRVVEPVGETLRDLAAARTRPGTVVLVDSLERFADARAGLWPELAAAPADRVITVVAGRERPDIAVGGAAPAGEIGLAELDADDAVRLLRARGVEPAYDEPVLAFAGGHPLALSLVAAGLAGHDGVPRGWTPPRDVVTTLLSQVIGDLPSQRHRRALEVCAHTAVTTEPLLRGTVDRQAAGELFSWLAGLPFIERTRHGLVPHGIARRTIEADLRWRDPQGYRSMHQGITQHLVELLYEDDESAAAGHARSLGYLLREAPVIRRYRLDSWPGDVVEDAVRPEDRSVLLAMTDRTEGARSAELMECWLDRSPEAFTVYRGRDLGNPIAFMTWLRITAADGTAVADDPVASLAWEHANLAEPVGDREHVAIARFLVDPAAYQRPSTVTNLMWSRQLVNWCRYPGLAWSYLALADPAFWGALMSYLGHDAIEPSVEVAARHYTVFARNWRTTTVGAWLAALGANEAGAGTSEAVGSQGLSRAQHDAAVRAALRAWHRPDALAASPLLRHRPAGGTRAGESSEALRDLLVEAVDALSANPTEAIYHRILAATFFHPNLTQEAAAQRLGIPFGTYRRHLATGTRLVSNYLWQRNRGPDG